MSKHLNDLPHRMCVLAQGHSPLKRRHLWRGPAQRKLAKTHRDTFPITALQTLQMNTKTHRAMQEKPGVETMLMYRFTFIIIVE